MAYCVSHNPESDQAAMDYRGLWIRFNVLVHTKGYISSSEVIMQLRGQNYRSPVIIDVEKIRF